MSAWVTLPGTVYPDAVTIRPEDLHKLYSSLVTLNTADCLWSRVESTLRPLLHSNPCPHLIIVTVAADVLRRCRPNEPTVPGSLAQMRSCSRSLGGSPHTSVRGFDEIERRHLPEKSSIVHCQPMMLRRPEWTNTGRRPVSVRPGSEPKAASFGVRTAARSKDRRKKRGSRIRQTMKRWHFADGSILSDFRSLPSSAETSQRWKNGRGMVPGKGRGHWRSSGGCPPLDGVSNVFFFWLD